ncbi:MAG: hypothetical protein SV186_03325 [Candidatus Nanohaloarchaea archaeon]|nr:hypothetical protein [Candidatus Nanohaloarchaea archaeon]
MDLGTEYRAVWSIDEELDEHAASRVAAAYLERVDDAAEGLGMDHGDDTLAEVHDRYGIEEEWHDLEQIERDDYDEVVLDDFDVRYTLDDGGFIRFEYDPEADGGDFRLRAGGGPRVRGYLQYELGKELEPTLLGRIRGWLEG